MIAPADLRRRLELLTKPELIDLVLDVRDALDDLSDVRGRFTAVGEVSLALERVERELTPNR